MGRPLRLEVAGGIHHVTARANADARLFHDDHERVQFLDCYAAAIDRHGWSSLAYCLMGTHYHLLVETPHANLARGMRDLNGSFARAIHRRRGSRGHVFAGRYFSRLVQRDAHLLETVRYIVRNPVEAGLCAHPREWHWSSYRATCRGADTPVLHAGRVLGHLKAHDPADPRRCYRAFVDRDGPAGTVEDIGVHGDHEFARAHVPPVLPSREIPGRFSSSRRPPLEVVLASASRDEAAAAAHQVHGYTLAEIGAAQGVHPTTVGRRIRALARIQT